jgi:hypothetical protein
MADLRIISQTLPLAFVGDDYEVRLQARGGTPPYTWSVPSGTLFTGMSLAASTGVLTGTGASLLGTEVGTRTYTVRVTDNVAATHDVDIDLRLRPSNYRRVTDMMLDPRLERVLSIWDVGVVTRQQVVAHFAQGPAYTSITPLGVYKEDKCVHYADQICYGETPASPQSPGASPGQTLWDKIQELDTGGKVLAEPQVVTISAYSSTETDSSPQTVTGFGPSSALLGEGLGVRITGQDYGPVYGSPEDTLGYFALGQRFTLPSAASPASVTLYLNRYSSPATLGNLVVGISTASPANIHLPAGSTALAYGDGSALVASGSLSLSSVSLDASRTAWSASHAYDIPLALNSPFTELAGSTNYYLVVGSDYTGSPFLEIAASVDDVSGYVAGSEAIALTATAGSPYHSPAAAASPVLYAPYELAGSPVAVTGLAFQLTAAWTGAVVGIVTLAEIDPYATSPTIYDRYWVGPSTATAADVRDLAFRIIDGHDRSSGSPVLDKTNFNELVDDYGNEASIVQVQTTGGAEVNPSGGGQTDADGFLSTGGAKLRVQLLPNSRGTLPELPFRVLTGSRRRISQLSSDSLIRTANKTGSTNAAVLTALAAATPSNPLLSINQALKPDASGNLTLSTGSGALVWSLSAGAYTAELQFAGKIKASNQGGSPTGEVDFDSTGVLTLDAADSSITLTPQTGSNTIQIAANVGVTTLNTVEADGSGNLSLVAATDTVHTTQTFTTIAVGSAANTVEIGTNIPDATTSLAGLLGTTDKQRINALFAGSGAVTTATTGGMAGGHAHEAKSLTLGRTLSGYSTLLSSMNIADALEAINTVLAAQFSLASEAPNLVTATTSYSAFATGYLATDTAINYSSPYLAGAEVTYLTEATSGTVITVTSAPFGNPGNSGQVLAQITGSPAASPWYTLDTLDLDQTYSNSLTAIGGSPPNYTSVASHMQANPLNAAGSPTSKISFQSVAYSGLDNVGAPVFELQVKATPVLSDMQNALGYNQIRLYQDTGSSTYASTAVTLIKDQFAGVSDPVINQGELTVASTVTPIWVSGVPHYAAATDPAFRINADNLFDIAYVQQPVRVIDLSDSPTAVQFNYYDTETASPNDITWIPSPEDAFHLGIAGEAYAVTTEDMTFVVAADAVSSRILTLEVSDPFGVQASQTMGYYEATTSPGRLLHMGRAGLSGGTLKTETFANEKYRLDPADWGGVDLVSPVASPSFVSISVQPAGNGTTDSDTYGWPNETALSTFSATNTWNATTGSPSAETRSGVSVTYAAGALSSLPAAVTDLGLVHPGFCELYNYDDYSYAPAETSPYNTYGALSSPLGYYAAYSAQGSVVYHRLFQSDTATNQGRLRIYGYKRGTASPTPTVLSYEDTGSPITMGDMTGSFYNLGPASSPTLTMSGISLEVKYPSATKTPLGNPGATGWLDMLTTPGSSLYALGEDGYGALDTSVHSPGMTQGSGYVDVYWRTGALTTGLSSNQAVVRVGIHDPEWVITSMQMLNQSTDTVWSNGA